MFNKNVKLKCRKLNVIQAFISSMKFTVSAFENDYLPKRSYITGIAENLTTANVLFWSNIFNIQSLQF